MLHLIICNGPIMPRLQSSCYESNDPFFNFIFFQNACVCVKMAPGRGHLCHIDTFLVCFSVGVLLAELFPIFHLDI